MLKFLNAFLEFKNEAEGTKRFALGAVVVITCGLALLSVTGVFATAKWSWGSAVPTIAFALLVTGVEALAAVSFVRVLLAPTRNRRIAGIIIFIGLAWIGVQNAKNGAHVVFPDRFAVSSAELSAKAALAGDEAETLGRSAEAALAASGGELERVRTKLADLRVEQKKMAAMSPEGIKEAQNLLIAQGYYYGRVDGIRSVLTEAAMRRRGEEIQGEIAMLQERENAFLAGQANPVQAATTDKRVLEIETQAKAEAAFWSALWLEVMLWVSEGARSLGLWVYVTAVTGAGVGRSREREEELAEAEHAARMAALRSANPPPQDQPVSKPVAQEDAPPSSQGPRKGGKNTAHHKEAAKAAEERLLILADRSAQSQAMKVAAE